MLLKYKYQSSILINLITLVFALVPFMGIYYFTKGITYDTFLLSLLFPLSILYHKRIRLHKKLIIFFAVILFIGLISNSISSKQVYSIFINNTLQVGLFALLLSYFLSLKLNKELFIRTIYFVGTVATIFLFYQALIYRLFNESIIYYLPLNTGEIPLETTASIKYGRPNSFFSEPAHYAIFLLPILNHSLFNRKYIFSIVFLIGLLISTSTTGFIIGISIIIYHTYKYFNKYVLFLTVSLLSIYFIVPSDLTDELINRNIIKLTESASLEGNIRTFSTLKVLYKLENVELFFGIGHNQLSNFMYSNRMDNPNNYANSFLMSIFSYGFVGLIMILYLLRFLYRANYDKGYFLIFLLIFMSDQILFNRNFFYLVSCIYIMNTIPSNKELESS